MRQVFQDISSGETKVVEVPMPQAAQGTVLVRTVASLISSGTERSVLEFAQKGLIGKARSRPDLVRQTLDKLKREGLASTLQAVRSRLGEPLPLGYSSAGVVLEVGAGVQGFRPGDRVACAGGGYAVHAEYAQVPTHLLALVPDKVEFNQAAFATLIAIAMHGFRLSGASLGERVCVIGMGLIGHLAAGVAKAAGCKILGVETDPARAQRAQALGIQTVQPGEAGEASVALTKGLGFDAVLICAQAQGDEVVQLAAEVARDRAYVVAIGEVGMDLPRRQYYEKELHFVVARSYGPGRYDRHYEEAGRDYPAGYVRWTEGRNLEAAVELLASGLEVAPLIDGTVPIQDAPRAYELISGDTRPLAVLLSYPEVEPRRDDRRLQITPARVSKSDQIALGAVGAGNFARSVLFPILKKQPFVRLVGVATASGLSGAQAAKQFGFEYATTDMQELLSDEGINTVAVLTQHHQHAGQVVAGLEAGKHVFCEKPLALSHQELDAIRQTLSEAPGLLTVGFNRRFAPLAEDLKAHFAPVDEPLFVHCRVNAGFLPRDHWLHDPEIGGGRLLGELCHFLDFMTFLVGSHPVRIRAEGMPDSGRYRGDNFSARVRFADGSLGAVDYLAKGDRGFGKERFELMGGGRMAVLTDFRELQLSAGGDSRRIRTGMDKGHRAIWEVWSQAIRNGEPPIPYDELFTVSSLTLAAGESLRSGEPAEMGQASRQPEPNEQPQ